MLSRACFVNIHFLRNTAYLNRFIHVATKIQLFS